MIEQPESKLPEGKKSSRWHSLALSPLLGGLVGGIAYGVSYFPFGQSSAEKIGFGVGGSLTAGGVGFGLASKSIENAEELLDDGRTKLSRVKLTQALAEGATGLGGAGGLDGYLIGGETGALVGAAFGAFWGAFGVFVNFRERTKPFPELVTPEGNSTYLDPNFPKRNYGSKLPSVFRSDSIADFQEFREANKEIIIKWAGESLATINSRPENIMTEGRLVSSVAIIRQVQHYPAFDPRENETSPNVVEYSKNDMKLSDTGEKSGNVIAHPVEHSTFFWAYDTIFDEITIGDPRFSADRWGYWKDKSWKHDVVLLAQYQTPHSFRTNRLNIGEVVDKYWLIDILTSEGGERKKVKKELFQGTLESIPQT
jgi:hypothetical protein